MGLLRRNGLLTATGPRQPREAGLSVHMVPMTADIGVRELWQRKLLAPEAGCTNLPPVEDVDDVAAVEIVSVPARE